MTLNEAIIHAEEVAEENQAIADACDYYGFDTAAKCKKCAEEHRQLAEWLEDYKRLKEQESVLDKIRAEIEQTTSRYTISRERGAMGQVEWSDRLIKESEVLQIIDKYKAESEDV